MFHHLWLKYILHFWPSRTQKQTHHPPEEEGCRPWGAPKCHWIYKADTGEHKQVRQVFRRSHFLCTPPFWPSCVCLQEHHCAAQSDRSRPRGSQLLLAAAGLRGHSFPHHPSGRYQLRLQVAARTLAERRSGSRQRTKDRPLCLCETHESEACF